MDVKQIRKVSGLNQTDFALAIGKSKNTIINWERGDTSPTQRDIDLIRQKFGHLEVQKNVPRETNLYNGTDCEKRLEEKDRVIAVYERTIFVYEERVKELKERITALEQNLKELSLKTHQR